jgi:hypothetical protein
MKHRFIQNGTRVEVETSNPDYIPPVSEPEGSIRPPVDTRRVKTADEEEIARLEVCAIKVSEVDDWVDQNVSSLDDVKAVLKQLVKMSCRRQKSYSSRVG